VLNLPKKILVERSKEIFFEGLWKKKRNKYFFFEIEMDLILNAIRFLLKPNLWLMNSN